MLRCYDFGDNKCDKSCKGKLSKCPLCAFLNGDRKTKPTKKIMEKFIYSYEPPKQRKRKKSESSELPAQTLKVKRDPASITAAEIEAAVERMMCIAYGDDYANVKEVESCDV